MCVCEDGRCVCVRRGGMCNVCVCVRMGGSVHVRV